MLSAPSPTQDSALSTFLGFGFELADPFLHHDLGEIGDHFPGDVPHDLLAHQLHDAASGSGSDGVQAGSSVASGTAVISGSNGASCCASESANGAATSVAKLSLATLSSAGAGSSDGVHTGGVSGTSPSNGDEAGSSLHGERSSAGALAVMACSSSNDIFGNARVSPPVIG